MASASWPGGTRVSLNHLQSFPWVALEINLSGVGRQGPLPGEGLGPGQVEDPLSPSVSWRLDPILEAPCVALTLSLGQGCALPHHHTLPKQAGHPLYSPLL